MNIGFLREVLSHIDEIKVIGKSVDVDGVFCNVLGIVRHGMEMSLLILQYDENFRQRIEELEEAGLFEISEKPENNRMMLYRSRYQQKLKRSRLNYSSIFILLPTGRLYCKKNDDALMVQTLSGCLGSFSGILLWLPTV